MSKPKLPLWIDAILLPFINISLALFIAGLTIALIGENPFEALSVMLQGAFTFQNSLGYTLYYTTNFIFTGLAVMFAFHAGLFNIGGEGQAAIAGLAVAFIASFLHGLQPSLLVFLILWLTSMVAGGIWGAIPGY